MDDEQTFASAVENLKTPILNPERSVNDYDSSPKPKHKTKKLCNLKMETNERT